MGVRVDEGRDVLARLGPRLDDLHDSEGVPLTARRPWLQAWIDSYPAYTPVAVVVESAPDRLEAAALLAVRRQRGVRRVVAMGHGPSDIAAMAARPGFEEALARSVQEWLASTGGPWTLTLRHLGPTDRVGPRLQTLLGRSRLVEGDVSPILLVEPGSSLKDYVSKRHIKQIRWHRNKMERDGLGVSVVHVEHSGPGLEAVLPEMERVFRARDAQLGRPCPLDRPEFAGFFREVVTSYAERGELRLTVLRAHDDLAAYALCFADGSVHRMWNCRFDPRWSRYSVGKVAVALAVEHALESGSTGFDFMRGDEDYKNTYATDRPRATDYFAWSGGVLAAGGRAYLRGRALAAQMESEGSRGVGLATAVRQLKARLG